MTKGTPMTWETTRWMVDFMENPKKMDDLEVWTDCHIRQSSGYYGY